MSVSRAAADKARALTVELKEHKRAVRLHRQAARRCKQELDQLRSECQALGIRLEVA